MKKCLGSLNELTDFTLAFENVKDPQAEIYRSHSSISRISLLPDLPLLLPSRKKLINLLFMKDRLNEELIMVNDEMGRLNQIK